MSKRPRGHIHRIREFELEKVNLVEEFDILQIVGEGWFGKILLVEHRASQTEMVLKAVPKPYVSLRDFYREFHYGLHLGIHRNIVTTFDVAFETAGFYVFTQEYAPLGDLTSNVTDTGVGEVHSKRVAKQIASALDYMHSKDIVHRDVKLDNVLIYRSDFSRVKLCDFGESYQTGTIVERRNEWLPYSPPEVLDVKPEGTYKADPSHDVWQFAIVIFVCLTGCLPWQKAQSDDPRYVRYVAWHDSMMFAIRRTPKLFKLLTNKAQRMFRRFLDPRFERRPKSLSDLSKFLDDRWLAKTAEKEMAEYETDELCPSMYSFHSSPDEKNRLLYTLADCGIETNVDRQSKKARIKDWIESSIIAEEDEEEAEETNSASPSSSVSREPVRGHISSIRTPKDIKTTLKDATQKHFDPRTGALQQGPSEMGVNVATQRAKSLSPTLSQLSTANNNDSRCGSLLTIDSQQELLNSQLTLNNSNLRLYNADEDANTGAYKPSSLMTRNTNNQNGLNLIQNNNEKSAIFASSPNINHQPINNTPQQQYGNATSSTTITGLTSAFQTLAQISLPMGGVFNRPQQQQQQPLQQQPFIQSQQQQAELPFGYTNNNNNTFSNGNLQRNDSQMRESGYGSADVSEFSLTRTNSNSSHQQNRNLKQMPPHMPQQAATGMRHNSHNSMKDTAYDRALFSNKRR